MIILDTSVLSLALRRRVVGDAEQAPAVMLRRMIDNDWPLAVPGIVLQELLSGVRTKRQFRTIRGHLEGFRILLAAENDHLQAADISNACRTAGISCSTVDALIAAQTIAADGQLFTTDKDFKKMTPCCGLELIPLDDTTTPSIG